MKKSAISKNISEQNSIDYLLSASQNMKNMILEQIKLIKQAQSKTNPSLQLNKNDSSSISQLKIQSFYSQKDQPTKKQFGSGFGIFKELTFCFPIVDIELTPKKIQCLMKSVHEEGGQVIAYLDKPIIQQIDFILCNPKMKMEQVRKKIQGKVQYKEILDYNFIINSIKFKTLQNLEKYSLFINIAADQPQKQPTQTLKYQEENYQEAERTLTRSRTQTVTIFDQRKKKIKKQLSEDGESETEKLASLDSEKEQDFDGDHRQPTIKKENFLCQGRKEQFSMNKFICDELMKLQKIYETQRDIGRKIAYLKAVSVIRSLDKEIESEKDLQNIKGIGKKITDKIKELMATGKLQKLEKLQQSEQRVVCGEFCKIWGVGPSKAYELFKAGIKSIEQLKTRTDLLGKNQRLGLKYFTDFQIRIPRAKVSRLFEFVRNTLKGMVDSIDLYRIQVCGSYRRQKESCGDVDIIISRKDGTYEKGLLLDLILELEKKKFLTDHLTFPKSLDTPSSMSYMGVCQFEDETHHRIDIKYYPISEFAYALLYFTGSGMFNRSMRLYATKLGLQLSDHGAVPRADKNGFIWIKPIPTCLLEEDIFKFLGLDYKTPQERDL